MGEEGEVREMRGGGDTAAGGPPYPRRQQAARHGASGGAMATDDPGSLQRRREGSFLENPLAVLKVITNWSSNTLVNLIEVFKYFQKFRENSHRLPMLFRSSTKIGSAK